MILIEMASRRSAVVINSPTVWSTEIVGRKESNMDAGKMTFGSKETLGKILASWQNL